MKLTYDDFFDFNDDTPLDQAIGKINDLRNAYLKMIQTVESSNTELAGELAQVASGAQAVLDNVKKLNAAYEGNQDALAGASKSSEELVKDYTALKTVEQDNIKLLGQLTNGLNEVEKAQEDLSKATKHEAGSYNDLKTKLAEAEKSYRSLGDATDKSIKDEHLAKIRGLSNEFKAVNGPLNDAKKGAIAAAGSYNELAAKVANAKKSLKEMEGGLHSNSVEFKTLQKFAADGTKQLKDWDQVVGDSQRNVGDYANQISTLIPGLGGLNSQFGNVAQGAKGLLTSLGPLGLIILAIGGALASLTAYFNGSIEGQDDLNKVMKVGAAIFETLKDVAEAVGKAIFEAISNPKKVIDAFITGLKNLKEGIKEAFTLEGLKAFGQALLDNVISRFEGLLNIFGSFGKILNDAFHGRFEEALGGFKDLGNAAIQAATGVKDGIDKMVEALQPFTDALQARLELGQRIAELENKVRKDRIADILDDAKTELSVVKLLVEARDKLRFTEEERFKKLRDANKLLEQQLEGDLQLARDEIKLQQLVIQQSGETYESRQKLVELQAKEIELQKSFFQARKKRQAEEIALIREIEKEFIDSRKRMTDADNALTTVRLNDAIATNKEILADENSTLEARLQAIANNDAAQLKLLEQDKTAQLDIAKEAALARVELSAETTDAIYSNEALSIQQRIELERSAKEELLKNDEAFQKQVLKIEEDFTDKTDALLDQSTKLAEENVFKVLARDADIASAKINTFANEALADLNKAFAAGDIKSVKEFEKEKLRIQQEAQQKSIESQIEYLRQRASLLEEGGKERVQIEEKISALEVAATKHAADEKLRAEKGIQDAIAHLKQVAKDTAISIIRDTFDRQQMAREEELSSLEEQHQKELELAGDNAAAKAALDKEFADKKKVIEQQQADANRRRAIFEKALAITEIGVNTAKGVGQALGAYVPPASFIIAGAVAAAGALQIAAVLSKPIPKFAQGTEDAPGGLAIINEEGPELIVHKGKGYIAGSDGPTMAYIPKHAQIKTADETERILTGNNYEGQIEGLKEGVDTVIQVARGEGYQELIDVFAQRLASLEHAVRTKATVHINYSKQGAEAMIRNAETNTKFLSDFYP